MGNRTDYLVQEYTTSDDATRSNANFRFNLSGLVSHIFSSQLKQYSLEQYVRLGHKDIAEAHISGDLHIHNLHHAFMCGYCTGWDLNEILKRGLELDSLESLPSSHFDVAIDHMINFACAATQEWSGAMAFGDVDTKLAPYVRKDGLNYEKVRQNIQRAIWNLNYPSRFGGQSPFVNWTLRMGVPKYLKGAQATVRGSTLGVYEDFQDEIEMIDKAIFDILMQGDRKHRPFTFPIPTVAVTKDFKWNSDLTWNLMDLAAERGSPYFLNYINYDEDASLSMCCRLRLSLEDARRHSGGIWNIGDSTGSIGVVTINMPRLGNLKDEKEILERLEYLMGLGRQQLKIKRKEITKRMKSGLLPITRTYLKTFDNHFSTLGFVGFNELCQNFVGVPIYETEGQSFTLKVLRFMNKLLTEFGEEDNILYNVEATPAEEVAGRFAQLDNYPKQFYTNSYHCPVDANLSLLERIKAEAPFHPLTTGGTVFHAFLGERVPTETLKKLVQRILSNFQIAYLSITPTLSICPKCAKIFYGNVKKCYECNIDNDIWSRIVGYYRPVAKWNEAKVKEFEARVQYTQGKFE
jgi:anaerobic ribonucleoside-triphosphate reductase